MPSVDCFELLFESSPHGMALVDTLGRPQRCNDALQSFLGYSQAELKERSFREFTHAEDVDLDWELYGQLTSGKRTQYQIDKRYLHKSGKVVWGRLTVWLLPGQQDLVLGMVEDLSTLRAHVEQRSRLVRELRERGKELNVLHELAVLGRRQAVDTLSLLRRVVELVPSAFQFPERTAVRIKVGALCQASETYVESPCRLAAEAELVNGSSLELSVVCWGKTPDPDREFLPEEQLFLGSIVEVLAGALDRRLQS